MSVRRSLSGAGVGGSPSAVFDVNLSLDGTIKLVAWSGNGYNSARAWILVDRALIVTTKYHR